MKIRVAVAEVCILLGLGFATAILASDVVVSKGQVLGRPAAKNWKVRVDDTNEGGKKILFSEDAGKTFFSVATCDGTTIVWSSDGKYFLFNCLAGPRGNAPYTKDGYLFYDPAIYDPAKRTIFSSPTNDALYIAANWVKKSKVATLGVKSFGNKGVIGEAKIAVAEWEKKSLNQTRVP